jgi:AraC-like DNA-binding protein
MATTNDQVRFCRPARLPGLELVRASYHCRAFPVHSHEEYVVGVTTAGAERLEIRDQRLIARAGDFILLEPGEAHSNRTVGDGGLTYAVFYIPADMVTGSFGQVRFPRNVVAGGLLARRWAELHRRMMSAEKRGGGKEGGELEGGFFDQLADVLDRVGSRGPVARPLERGRVARAREYLDACFAEPLSLVALAQMVGLSPYHLLRTFRDQVGITPGAYQIQRRVLEARRRLRDGAAIADTAADLGFADQSHLSRHFQRIMGTSPGRYAQQ